MPRTPPTLEMRTFGTQFGGVLVRDDDLPFGELPTSDPALLMAWNFLDDFKGTRNSYGEVFSCDLQLLENFLPNAVCGLERGCFCIGVYVGLQERILEIAAALVHVMFMRGAEDFC